jgi:hypothetical protein
VLLGYTIPLSSAAPPDSPARRDAIEIFRPIGGRCQSCGAQMLALFDVLVDPNVHRGLPAGRRLFIPMCPKCSHDESEGYSSRVRIDDRAASDVDAWSGAGAATDEPARRVPARQFRPVLCDGAPDGRSPAAPVDAWFGGSPRWEQYAAWPKCELCRRRMIFAGQVNAGPTYYGFFCRDCLTSNVRTQYD